MALFRIVLFGSLLLLACSCNNTRPTQKEDAAPWQKVHIDFRSLDNDGLSGPAGGKVSVHYEFCIPAGQKYWKEVQKIDTSARLFNRTPGRIGCSADQILVIGNTRQPQYKHVLYQLASQSYIERIETTFWE